MDKLANHPISGEMTVHELRSRILALKDERRKSVAALPILKKFQILERMKEDAAVFRAYRERRKS
ncbi:MAG: hypothetical protein ABI443_01155 [Chthoniobacterales bacterium]